VSVRETKKKKSGIVYNSTNPVWNEEFQFLVANPEHQVLKIGEAPIIPETNRMQFSLLCMQNWSSSRAPGPEERRDMGRP
jgi:C2 domain